MAARQDLQGMTDGEFREYLGRKYGSGGYALRALAAEEDRQMAKAKVRLRKVEEYGPTRADVVEVAEVVEVVVPPPPVTPPVTGYRRSDWKTFDFGPYDLAEIAAKWVAGVELRKLIPAGVPAFLFSEKLNNLGYRKGVKAVA